MNNTIYGITNKVRHIDGFDAPVHRMSAVTVAYDGMNFDKVSAAKVAVFQRKEPLKGALVSFDIGEQYIVVYQFNGKSNWFESHRMSKLRVAGYARKVGKHYAKCTKEEYTSYCYMVNARAESAVTLNI